MTTNVSEKADSSFVELASIHTGGDGLNSTEKTLLERIESLERSKADTERVLLERIEALEQQPKGSTSENEPLIQNEEKPPLLTDSAISRRADTWELPESTYTLLIAEKVMSVSFTVGLVASAISLMSLIIVLVNELDNGTDDNPFGLPAGVSPQVRMAQFLGVIIGVLMEEEIPIGLESLGKGLKQDNSLGGGYDMRKIVFSSILRLTIGYLFLLCLFLTVIQESDVLDIFFDVLALEFVESIDDVIFELCKRGFFGRVLRNACTRDHHITIFPSNENMTFKKWTFRFIRFVYFLNASLMIIGLVVLTMKQDSGAFRCKSFSLAFGDDTWEESWVILDDGSMEKRLLVYSHFNGIYIENGTHDGKPKYSEQNKEDSSPFRATTPAEIVYCQDIESWVFRHDKIRISNDENLENECNWLLISPETEDFDVIDVSIVSTWSLWKGQIAIGYSIAVSCTECNGVVDCNYHGQCNDQRCSCDDQHFGIHCEFSRPCDMLKSSKDLNINLNILKDAYDTNVDFVEVYGRPMYVAHNLTGKPYGLLRFGYPDDDDNYFEVEYNSTISDGKSAVTPHKHLHPEFFEDDDFFQLNNVTPAFHELLKNYTFILWYSGMRWYGQLHPPGITSTNFVEEVSLTVMYRSNDVAICWIVRNLNSH